MRWEFAALHAAAALTALSAHAIEVHGEKDVFSRDGVSLAWSVLRGADEARTVVVVRVLTRPPIRAISVKGRDPFTSAEKVLVDRRPTSGQLDIRLPRAGFADFPRTEWMFYTDENEPRLVIFYLGVPDTAPEFADATRLDAYLDKEVPWTK